MALTVTYSFNQVFPKTQVPTLGTLSGSNSDTVGLSGGGWATSVTDTDGFSDISFYNAAGTLLTTDAGFSSAGGRLAQLTNGNVVAVGGVSGGGVNFHIDTAAGAGVTSGSVTSVTTESNADVAALTGGGFVVVDQRSFTAPDNDIEVHLRDAAGNVVSDFSIDTSLADDERASVTGLADGGFAVAWDRTDSGGSSSLWYSVYNADGSQRLGPTELDGFGSINTTPNVTALKSGGFTIGYGDNGWDGTQPDTTVASFNSAGTFQNWVRGSSLSSDDSQVSVTTLSNGLVMSSFTNNFNNGGDLDIRGTLIDPTTGVALTDVSNPIAIDFSGEITSQSSISATGLAQFAVSYTNASTGAVDVQAYQLVRTVLGTTGADNFVGDDAVNIVNSLGGDDVIKGGNNTDTLNGGAGNDQLFGLGGNDLLVGGTGNDVINGGLGLDTASYSSFTTAVTVSLAISGPQNTGAGGVDTLVSIENLTGGGGSDTLIGSSVGNTLIGAAGDDVITGGGGSDKLTGGGGFDRFVYTTVSDTGSGARDTITDFSVAQDTIDLAAIDANTTVGGDQAFTFIGVAGFTGVAGQLDVSHVGANTFVQGDINGDKVKDFQIQLTGNISLSASNFTL